MDNELAARLDTLEAILIGVLNELNELKGQPVSKEGHKLMSTEHLRLSVGNTLTIQAETDIEQIELNIWTKPVIDFDDYISNKYHIV